LFVADALSVVLQKEVDYGQLEELRVSRNTPEISHLLFIDDALLFFKAEREQAEKIIQILDIFQAGTGQLLSPSKCSILVQDALDPGVQEQIHQILHVERVDFDPKYLGLPTPDGRQKKERFQSVKEKISKRISTWTEKHLSVGAKDMLIKSIAQAIPTYMMSVFHLSASVSEDLERAIRKFWWGEEENQRRTHCIAWDKFTRSKGRGGLGFRDLKIFNQALLGRQAWCLIAFPDSLCTTLMKAKYFPNGDLLDTAFPTQVSPTWRAIMHGLELLKRGAIWRVCNGTKHQNLASCMDPSMEWHKASNFGVMHGFHVGSR
jgi:hypothetical protein